MTGVLSEILLFSTTLAARLAITVRVVAEDVDDAIFPIIVTTWYEHSAHAQ